jgi:Phage protein Gp138 N-terminal domain
MPIGLDPQQSPSLAQVIAQAFEARLAEVHVGMPGTVVSYNAARQTAVIQLALQRSYEDSTGTRQVETIAPLQDVPIVFQRGGGYFQSFPLAKGDPVWVQFAESCLDRYLGSGGAVVDPGDDRRHAVSDAVATPGCSPFAAAIKNAPTDRARLGKDGGPYLDVTSSQVQCGGTAALTLTTELQQLLTALSAFLVSVATATTAVEIAGYAGTFTSALTTLGYPAAWPLGTQTTKGA